MRSPLAKTSTTLLLKLGVFIEFILPMLTPNFYWLTGISCALILIGSVRVQKPDTAETTLKLTLFFYLLALLHAFSVAITALFCSPEYSNQGFNFLVSHYKLFLLIFGLSLLHAHTQTTAVIGETLELAFWSALALLLFQLLGETPQPVTKQITSAGMMFFTVPNDATYLVLLGSSAIALSSKPRRRLLLIPILCALLSIYFESRLTLFLSTLSYLALLHKMRGKFQAKGYRLFFAAPPLLMAWLLVESNLGEKVLATTLWNERLSLWWAGVMVWPGMFGEGVGSFLMAYEEAKATGQIPAFLPVEPRPVHWAHNIFVEAFHERGLIGLGLISLLVISVSANIVRWCARASDWSHAWPLAIFILVCVMEASLYNHPSLLLLGLLIFLATLPHRRNSVFLETRNDRFTEIS